MGTGPLQEEHGVQETWDGSSVKHLAPEPPEQAVSELLRSLGQPEHPDLSVHLHGNILELPLAPLPGVHASPKGLGKLHRREMVILASHSS